MSCLYLSQQLWFCVKEEHLFIVGASVDLHVGCIWGDVFSTYVQKPNLCFIRSQWLASIDRRSFYDVQMEVDSSHHFSVMHAEVWVLHRFQAKMKRFPSRVSIWVQDICSCSLSVHRISQTLTIKQTFLRSQSSCSLKSNDMIFVSAIFTLNAMNEYTAEFEVNYWEVIIWQKRRDVQHCTQTVNKAKVLTDDTFFFCRHS